MDADTHVDLTASYDENGDVVVEPGSDTQWFSVQLLANANDRWLRVEDGNVVVTSKNCRLTYRIDGVEDMSPGGGAFAVRTHRVYAAGSAGGTSLPRTELQ